MNQTTSHLRLEDKEILHQRLLWLIGMRWYAVPCLVVSTFGGRYVLGMHFPTPVLYGLAGIMAAYNFYYSQKVKSLDFPPRIALEQIILDVLILSLTLFFTGGFLNPFFTFYFFVVIIAYIILPQSQSIGVTVFVTLCFALQGLSNFVVPVDMRLSREGMLKMGELPFHVIGAPVSFVVTTVVTAYFVSVITRDLQKREREVRDARQQAELELHKLDNILRHLETGMIVVNQDEGIEWINDRIEDWFGTEGRDENKACFRVGCFAKKWMRNWRIMKEDTSRFHEIRLPTRSKGLRDFEILISPIYDERGTVFQVIELVLDVTEQKKNQAQWARAQKLAAIGQLAAGVAHEINTPLGTIRILAEEARDIIQHALEQQECSEAKELEEALETIYGQVDRCKTITQGLLNFSRKTEDRPESCDVNEVVLQAIDLVYPKISKVTIDKRLDESLPIIVTESNNVQRVLFNLLLNAADALESIDGERRIEIETTRNESEVGIRIMDNGCGIRREVLPHIFEPFYTTKDFGKGTGLGLYVSYGILQDLGGRLEIDSEPGLGTLAEIWLPIHDDNQ